MNGYKDAVVTTAPVSAPYQIRTYHNNGLPIVMGRRQAKRERALAKRLAHNLRRAAKKMASIGAAEAASGVGRSRHG